MPCRGGEGVELFVLGVEHVEAAVGEGGFGVPQVDQATVVVEDRVGVGELGLGIDGAVVGVDGDPGVPAVNPAWSVASHCMGVRALSRLRWRRPSRTLSSSAPRAVCSE
jgi:hypothetical protein